MIRCDQGGELARSEEFRTKMMVERNYIMEPTGTDDPAPNGGVEPWNGLFAVTVRVLLYGAVLSAVYWPAALVWFCVCGRTVYLQDAAGQYCF
jgi:hypothetical protein